MPLLDRCDNRRPLSPVVTNTPAPASDKRRGLGCYCGCCHGYFPAKCWQRQGCAPSIMPTPRHAKSNQPCWKRIEGEPADNSNTSATGQGARQLLRQHTRQDFMSWPPSAFASTISSIDRRRNIRVAIRPGVFSRELRYSPMVENPVDL